MPSGCFIDTNVLIYARDRQVPQKRARAAEWLRMLADENRIVISPQVMNEFAHNVIRKLPEITPEQLHASLQDLQQWCTAFTTAETALNGLAIHRRFQFSFYDSVLIASALAVGCDAFLSEDLAHGQRVATLRIINPFLADPGAARG
jgi:predicted nucleic acid-binding protein